MNNNYKILAKGVCLLNMISTIWIFLDKIKYDYSDPSKRKIFGKIIGNIMLSCHPDLNSNCTPEQKQHLNNVQIILDILSKLDITKPVISSKPLALIPAQKLLTDAFNSGMTKTEIAKFIDDIKADDDNLETNKETFAGKKVMIKPLLECLKMALKNPILQDEDAKSLVAQINKYLTLIKKNYWFQNYFEIDQRVIIFLGFIESHEL